MMRNRTFSFDKEPCIRELFEEALKLDAVKHLKLTSQSASVHDHDHDVPSEFLYDTIQRITDFDFFTVQFSDETNNVLDGYYHPLKIIINVDDYAFGDMNRYRYFVQYGNNHAQDLGHDSYILHHLIASVGIISPTSDFLNEYQEEKHDYYSSQCFGVNLEGTICNIYIIHFKLLSYNMYFV